LKEESGTLQPMDRLYAHELLWHISFSNSRDKYNKLGAASTYS